jgi:hypothetical protein
VDLQPTDASELDTELDLDTGGEPARRSPGRWILLPLLVAVVAIGWAVSVLLPGHRPPAPPVGRSLPVGVSVQLPDGLVSDVDGQYVSVHLTGVAADAATILLTTPTRVAGRDGVLSALPADPARWLRDQPAIRVTRVDHVLVSARHAVQIDYRLGPTAGGTTVPLFCGVGPAENRNYPWAPLSCSRISADARVRATFIPVDGRTLLVEASWSRAAAGAERMPARLETSYRGLLDRLTFVAR